MASRWRRFKFQSVKVATIIVGTYQVFNFLAWADKMDAADKMGFGAWCIGVLGAASMLLLVWYVLGMKDRA